MEGYKVLITTSGIGARLGDLTKYTNKSLVRIGKKPALSYIIEKYSKDTPIVITLGYYGNQVKDFLELAYPDRDFTFVDVDLYDGLGSSLGYSILKAKDHLQCSFIYHASDTIVTEVINPPDKNWLAYRYKENSSQYRTLSGMPTKIINEKGDFDSKNVYIGLCGIKDYDLFWKSLESEYNKNVSDQSLSDCQGINGMCVKWDTVRYNSWLDIGNVTELSYARHHIYDKFELLDKVDESIFLFDDFVIKFFYDKNICRNRVERCKELEGLTPRLIGYKDNFYKYEYANGELLSRTASDIIFKRFLDWSLNKLWIKKGESKEFKEICYDFYINKTNKRLDDFYKKYNIEDTKTIINGYDIPSVKELLDSIDKDWLCSDAFYQFHGDFIPDNILVDGEDFTLLDWRQDFGGDISKGDIYYDLGKMNHNLLFNHDIVHKGLYTLEESGNEIKLDILRSDTLTNCRQILHKFILDHGFDLKKVSVLTSIIWLNMSPLHEPKMGRFLYYLGKINLYKSLC